MSDREYQCCFCEKGMPVTDSPSHRLDPCALIIVGHWIAPPKQQLSQQYFCHLHALSQIREKQPLYIEEMEPGDQA